MAISPLHNEHLLLARASEGSQAAFTIIFNHYYQFLGQAIFPITKSITLTQEIVQDAFVTIWLRRESLREIENFSGYLYVICRNRAFLTLKKLARERKLQPLIEQELKWEKELDELENPSEHYRKLIREAVEKLPPQQKKIYMLSRQEGLKYNEIASLLGISPETVKTQVYAAVKFIRRNLGPGLISVVFVILNTTLQRNF